MTKILVLGRGLLGSHLAALYGVDALSHAECDITSPFDVSAALAHYSPDVVINCAGIVPKATGHSDVLQLYNTNARGPRILQAACNEADCRLIQISTDCVFSGLRGAYSEVDTPDPNYNYGMSKYLGEVIEYPHVTLRTSFIGLPDLPGHGLLAWAKQSGGVLIGYDQCLWNGLTTVELARVIREDIIPGKYSDIVHICSAETVSKYEVLVCANRIFGWGRTVVQESQQTDTPHAINRTLTSELSKFIVSKPIAQQLEEMRECSALKF